MTHTYVALLRAVNVGGRNKLPMAELRRLLEDLGQKQVQTYLQSGNAVFTSDRSSAAAVAAEIEQRLEDALSLRSTVILRTPGQLEAVVAANPLPQAADVPAKLHVAFPAGPVPAERLEAFDGSRFLPDELHPGPDAVYLWYPDGAGRSRLTSVALERALGVPVTARNWKSVVALRELARQVEAGPD